jgi:hypothetical protein
MTENKESKERILKVEEVGDRWRKRTFPRIRVKGRWLAKAGIHPNTYVRVTNPHSGMLVVYVVDFDE